MNKKQYNNVIDWTLKHDAQAQSEDSLQVTRTICNELGVALPQGDLAQVSEVLATNDYMGWKACTQEEAQAAANQGVAVIGINKDRIVFFSANDDEQAVAQTASVITLDENRSALAMEGMRCYLYSCGTTCQGGNDDNIDISSNDDRYTYELVQTFGFTNEVAMLIRSLYDKVDNAFCCETNLQRAWKCSRLLSMFSYDGIPWDNVAASVVSLSNAQEYFTNILGYTISEYNTMKNAIINQHYNYSTPDFTHMQYALSARLAYTLDKDDFWANIVTLNTDENISYLAGWLGDATLVENGTTSMADDDYCADLDAENIYRFILQGRTSISAIDSYYSNLSSCFTRAHQFLSYINYTTVQEKVFYELIDKDLTLLVNSASQQGNIYLVNYYINLINNEQYHWDTISASYPDTYNFLRSLQNGEAHIVEY